MTNNIEGDAMSTWPEHELQAIAEADDLHIAPFRDDGVTYGTPTWIWSVAVDGALYVRGYNGTGSRWYQAAVRQKAGRITSAGMTKDVGFAPVAEADGDGAGDACGKEVSIEIVPGRACPGHDDLLIPASP